MLESLSCSGEREILKIAREPEVFDVLLIQAGKHRDSEDLDHAFGGAGGLEDGFVPVRRRKRDVAARESSNGGSHGLGNVEEFEVDKDFLAQSTKVVDQAEI